jgi:hypothetical protein
MLEVVLWILAVFVVLALTPLVAAILIGRAQRRRAAAERARRRAPGVLLVGLAVLG